MFNVQVLNSIAAEGLNQFPSSLYHIVKEIEQPDAILVRSYNMHEIKIADKLLVVGRAGVGVNNIPIETLTQAGIPVLNTPGANTNAVCELVIAGMLLACRNLCKAREFVNQLESTSDELFEQQVEANKKNFAGSELRGKTLGVIGLGNIGVQVANVATHLGMHILGFDPSITVERAWQLSAEVKQAKQLEELLANSDFITLHVPLLPETKAMISADRLNNIKKDAILLNFSRHDIVDDDAILAALQRQQLAGYVSDFPALKMQNHPKVINLPHLGASTREAEENCAVMIARQVRNFLEYGTITNSVNFPSIDLADNPLASRISLIHSNMPGMVAQISTCLATENINIISLQNGSRDKIAYTIIDIVKGSHPSLVAKLTAIHGMIRVRQIC